MRRFENPKIPNDSRKQRRETLKRIGRENPTGVAVIVITGVLSIVSERDLPAYEQKHWIGIYQKREDAEMFCAKHRYNLATGKVE